MLTASGVSSTIIGHSERRALGESDEAIAQALLKATEAGLRTVLCIGEKERDQQGVHFGFLEQQLQSALAAFPKASAKNLVIAYEPVWAIGKSAQDALKPTDLREMGIFIRKILTEILGRTEAMKVLILYGGSVETDNARALMSEGDVNGLLIGRSSTNIDSFLEILKAVSKK